MRTHLIISTLGYLQLAAISLADADVPRVARTSPLKLAVQVDLIAKGSSQRRPIQPGEVLSTGDRLAIRAEVERSAYVFVLQENPGGGLEGLWPADDKSGGLPLEPGVQTTLPAGGGLFELDAATGKESLYVVASTRPLTLEEAKTYSRSSTDAGSQSIAPTAAVSTPAIGVALRGAPAPAAPPPPPPPPPPPHPVGSTERQPPCDAQVHLMRASSNGQGEIVAARFCFEHSNEDSRKSGSPTKK